MPASVWAGGMTRVAADRPRRGRPGVRRGPRAPRAIADLARLGHRVRRSGAARPRAPPPSSGSPRRLRGARRPRGGADLVVSAVTAAQLPSRPPRRRPPGLAPGAWFFDLNSSSPGHKQPAAARRRSGRRPLRRGRGDVADRRPAASPRRSCSAARTRPEFAPVAAGLGLSGLTVYSDEVGRAAATKLCRSVMVKGLEALLTESLLAARHYGVEQEVLDSLSNILPPPDWQAVAAYFISRSLQHGRRRPRRWREAAATVAEAGVEPADVARGRRSASAGRPATPMPLAELDLAAVIDHIRRAAGQLDRGIRCDHRLPRSLHDRARPRTPTGARRSSRRSATGRPAPAYPAISDDEIRESIEQNQLRLLRERGADLTIFSPRASAMAHHVGDERGQPASGRGRATT